MENCYRCGDVLSATLKRIMLLGWELVFIQLTNGVIRIKILHVFEMITSD